MKKLFILAATVAAMFSLSSCESLKDKLPINYWYCGDELVICGGVKSETSKMGDTELSSIILTPKQTGLNSKIQYGFVVEKQYMDKALTGAVLEPKDLLFTSYSALDDAETYISALGTLVAGAGKFSDLKFAAPEGTIKVSLSSSNYFTMTADIKVKAIKKVVDGETKDIPEAEQKEYNLSAHYAGFLNQ